MTNLFSIVFAVPLECESCVKSVSGALDNINGIDNYDVDLKQNTVKTHGSVAPSEIVRAIQGVGKDAVIRGTGAPNSAAVCIMESFDEKDKSTPVKGLARIVSVGEKDVVIDLTMNGLNKGVYYPSIRTSGNLSRAPFSTGRLFYELAPVDVSTPADESTVILSLGSLNTSSKSNSFSGQAFLQGKLDINDLIGRSMILSRIKDEISPDSLCGVIARSAGIWENNKQVCSCTGKSLWQERTDSILKGIRT